MNEEKTAIICIDGQNRVTLTDEQIEAIYRMQRNAYQLMDVKAHCEDYTLDEVPTDDDYQGMVNMFNDKHDCNIAENDLWEAAIETYLEM